MAKLICSNQYFSSKLTRGTYRLYIYSSLVNGVTVNEKILPLLATVQVLAKKLEYFGKLL